MLELRQYYYDYYTQPSTSPVKYFYAPCWMNDDDIEEWKNNSELNKNAVIIKMQGEGTDRFGDINTYKINVHRIMVLHVLRNLMIHLLHFR